MNPPFRRNPLLRWFSLLLAVAPVTQAPADVILDWNTATLNAIRATRVTPQFASRNLAMTHAAMFDAVNAITRTHMPYHYPSNAAPDLSREAAAATAAHDLLVVLFASQAAVLDASLQTSLAVIPDGPGKAGGIALGRDVARDMLLLRQNDGASNSVPYGEENVPGRWRPTPPASAPAQLPHWPYVTPFALPRGDLFRPAGPPALTGSQYTFDFNQVKSLGDINSTSRTPDQTQIARFWLDGGGTMTPPGHWNLVAQAVATSRNLTLEDNARMFALLNLGLADAGIAAWDAKYNTFPFWRPITAIREASTDGNPDTIEDAAWTPLVPTPPHPDYVSGHATFSGCGAAVLAQFLGTNDIPFTVGSDDLPGVTRSFGGFADAARECSMSRLYAGIHMHTALVDGQALGRSVGLLVMRNYLLPRAAVPFLHGAAHGPDARFQATVTGLAGDAYTVESTSDLSEWTPFTQGRSPFRFSDTDPLGFGSRLYRARRPLQGF